MLLSWNSSDVVRVAETDHGVRKGVVVSQSSKCKLPSH